MLAPASVGAVTGPALVIIGAPLYPATQPPSVRSSGCTSSHLWRLGGERQAAQQSAAE